MTSAPPNPGLAGRAIASLKQRVFLLKAVSFALIGAVNAVVDACVFFVVYWLLTTSAGAAQTVAAVAAGCRCASPETVTLVVANVVAWMVAVSGSYVMNSNITFAAESGRQLRWRAYLVFVASGVLAMTASTTTLVLAARVMPVWAAKGVAILVSFVVNFSMSHFIVFRPRREAGDATSR